MNGALIKRVLLRHALPAVIVACALVVLALAGWQALLDRYGGDFPHAPEDAHWVLSKQARHMVNAAFDDLSDAAVVDSGVQVIATGKSPEGAPKVTNFHRRGAGGPLSRLTGQLQRHAAGIDGREDADAVYVSRLLRQVRAMPVGYHVRLLAQGWRYDDDGQRDAGHSWTHVANAYIWWLARQAPEIITPVVSIHPYRKDAEEQLAKWADKGIEAVTWQPIRQNIDLDDARTRAFYKVLAKHDMTLHLPVGRIDDGPAHGRIKPLALQPALAAGVHVMVAVRASGHTTQDVTAIGQLVQLLNGEHADQIRVSLAGVLTDDALAGVLMPLLQHPQLYAHFRYASNYPLSAVDRRIHLQTLAEQGYIADAAVAPLREIYHVNPLLFVYVLMRNVHLPQTRLQLPASVFADASD